MLRRSPHLRPASPRARWRPISRIAATLRGFDDWRQVLTLRVIVPMILALVSFYYLYLWALANSMPWWLAWTLPAALDVTAYKAVTVARHPVNRWAKWKASALAWLCVALSVAGNIGSHALQATGADGRPLLVVSIWTISATSAVYPLMLIAGHIVAGGMTKRPLSADRAAEQAAAADAARLAVEQAQAAETAAIARAQEALQRAAAAEAAQELADAARREAEVERAEAAGELDAARAEIRGMKRRPAPAPAPAPAAEQAPAQVRRPVPVEAPGEHPGDTRAAPAGGVTLAQAQEEADAYMLKNPTHGRRLLFTHLCKPDVGMAVVDGAPLTDHRMKPIHRAAKAAAAAAGADVGDDSTEHDTEHDTVALPAA
jgi:hypothetical protein